MSLFSCIKRVLAIKATISGFLFSEMTAISLVLPLVAFVTLDTYM